jgi:hypothetical protein
VNASAVVGKLANHVLDGALDGREPDREPSREPSARARERLARAEASAAVVDEYAGLAVPMAMLAGLAVALVARR